MAASVSAKVPPSAEITSIEQGNGGSRLSADRTVSFGLMGYMPLISAAMPGGVSRQQMRQRAAHLRAGGAWRPLGPGGRVLPAWGSRHTCLSQGGVAPASNAGAPRRASSAGSRRGGFPPAASPSQASPATSTPRRWNEPAWLPEARNTGAGYGAQSLGARSHQGWRPAHPRWADARAPTTAPSGRSLTMRPSQSSAWYPSNAATPMWAVRESGRYSQYSR